MSGGGDVAFPVSCAAIHIGCRPTGCSIASSVASQRPILPSVVVVSSKVFCLE
jgi:hypothetical protein